MLKPILFIAFFIFLLTECKPSGARPKHRVVRQMTSSMMSSIPSQLAGSAGQFAGTAMKAAGSMMGGMQASQMPQSQSGRRTNTPNMSSMSGMSSMPGPHG